MELICFYCMFVYNGVNSPLIVKPIVKPTLLYQNKVLLLLSLSLLLIIIINIIVVIVIIVIVVFIAVIMYCLELSFKSLENTQWFRKICSLSKIFKNKSPGYLYSIILQRFLPLITRNIDAVSLFNTKNTFYNKKLFLPAATIE